MSLRKQPFLKLSYNKITAATGIPVDQHDILVCVIKCRLDYHPLFGKMSPHSSPHSSPERGVSLRGGSKTGPGRGRKSSLNQMVTSVKLFPHFTSIPFDYLLISQVTNYVCDLGFLTCLFWIVSIENSKLSNVQSLNLA